MVKVGMGTSCLSRVRGLGRGREPRSAHSLPGRPEADQAPRRFGLLLLLAGLLLPTTSLGDAPEPLVEVRAIRPDAQGEAVIALFEGTAWPHPAAALSDWKRSAAEGEERTLGKPLEALITAVNPWMVRELATFDGTRFFLDLGPEPGDSPEWAVLVPSDDGTISALATAMVLTDGLQEDPEGAFQVDRIGPPGAPLVASLDRGGPAILASDRRALARAIDRLNRVEDGEPEIESGWIVRAEPRGMLASGSVLARQIGEGAIGLGYPTIEARARLIGESLEVEIEGPAGLAEGRADWGAIDPSWLDLIPAERASVAASAAVGQGGDPWDGLLSVLDRIERADPTRAEVAPIRQRLAVLGFSQGIRPEVDLWPLLIGMTAWAEIDESGGIGSGLIALHARDEAGASRISRRVVERVLGGEDRWAQTVCVGSEVLIGFGPGAIEATLQAKEMPDRSAGTLLRGGWPDPAVVPSRVVGVWPSRLPWFEPEIRAALEAAPPAIWLGWSQDETTREFIRWTGLRGPVRSFLAKLPAEPAPRLDAPSTDPEEGR